MAQAATSTNTVRLPSADDQALIELMGKLAALSKDARIELHVLGRSIGSYANTDEVFSIHPRPSWAGRRVVNLIEVSGIGSARVRCHRAVTSFEGATPRVEPSDYEVEVSVLWRPDTGEPPAETLIAVSGLLDEYRASTRAHPLPKGGKPSGYEEVFARQIADLTTLQTQMLRDADETRSRREAELDERRKSQDQAFDDLKARFAEEQDLQRRLLQVQEQALEKRKQEIDDRNHMHARRALRGQITEDLRGRLSRPAVSRSTTLFRLAIFVAGSLLVAMLGTFAFQSGLELATLLKAQALAASDLPKPDEPVPGDLMSYVLIGRAALAATGAVALGFYLLSWARQLHDADLRSQRDLERYLYDIDRATWAIETVLEVQKASDGGTVPDQWIAGATNALFARSERRDEDQNSVEALGALLSFAAEAELGPGGTKIKLTKQGINRLKRSGLVADAEE